MEKGKRKLATTLLAAAIFTTAGTSAQAALYIEPGDAGQTFATAAPAGTATQIDGTIASGNASDADLYQLTLATGGSYTFSTVNAYTTTGGVDTELALFTAAGVPILENDDANGTTIESSITTMLAAGTYYIGVASSMNEPVNSNNQLLFVGLSQSGDTTAVRGPASGVNPTTFTAYNSNEYDTTTTGQYQIGITGPVPEPSTWAMFGLGAFAAGFAFLRRRQPAA